MTAHRILVVDDEPDVEALVTQRFRRRVRAGELEFRFAGDGQQALDMLMADPGIDFPSCEEHNWSGGWYITQTLASATHFWTGGNAVFWSPLGGMLANDALPDISAPLTWARARMPTASSSSRRSRRSPAMPDAGYRSRPRTSRAARPTSRAARSRSTIGAIPQAARRSASSHRSAL